MKSDPHLYTDRRVPLVIDHTGPYLQSWEHSHTTQVLYDIDFPTQHRMSYPHPHVFKAHTIYAGFFYFALGIKPNANEMHMQCK